jgi:phage/plasmid-associated DNA primase
MWEHLASCLIGVNYPQTFNIYTGCGSNGKSKLVELMSLTLGEYKAVVPISLITSKRASIGGTSSEIAQLVGIRYAVMQEPSKGMRLEEGPMKEITGGDPIQGRALFKNMITFIPQFKLVVCTNTLFDIKANDEGTWRRIRKVDHKAIFCENPRDDDPDKPYQYLIDKRLDEKFKTWAPVFLAMLVEKAFQTGGMVKDTPGVLASSENYRNSQDYMRDIMLRKQKCMNHLKFGISNNMIEMFLVVMKFMKYLIRNMENIQLKDGKVSLLFIITMRLRMSE